MGLPSLLTQTTGGLRLCPQPGVISCEAQETAFGLLFIRCLQKKQFQEPSLLPRQFKVPSDKLRLTPSPPQFPRPQLLLEAGHPQPLGWGRAGSTE